MDARLDLFGSRVSECVCVCVRRQAALGAGVAVVLGGVEPGAVGARPPRALRGRQRAAAAAHGGALHRPEERAVLLVVLGGGGAPRPALRHVQRRRALQLHQPGRVHARHSDGDDVRQRGAERRALRRVLLVPGVHVDHRALPRVHRAPRLEVRRDEAQPAPAALLRAVPQLRAAAARSRRAPLPRPHPTRRHALNRSGAPPTCG